MAEKHDHAAEPHDHPHGGHHDHAHSHVHSHRAAHVHMPADFGPTFKIAIALNVAIVALQAGFGWAAGSMALLADAGHNLSDVLGLVVAYAAVVLSRKKPSPRFTWGLGNSSILAALFNAVFLLVAVGALSWEAIERLRDPRPVAGMTVIVVAAIGMVLNGVTAWMFASGGRTDINIRGAFLHMAADAAVSAGVVLSGILILLTGWLWLDPLAGLLINVVIVWGTWSLLRQSLDMSLAAVPATVDYDAVRAYLASRPGVARMHDLHIWPTSTTETALTAHLVMPAGFPGDAFLMEAAAGLKDSFAIGHVTLQVETGEDTLCEWATAHPA
ncbi:cation diffusion facilitator family transporter [uncultured Enterovirga sp.]|uniref:cation diffusion facilitator family transporter n=1 Tax=uncultured Enterovirga sp. TaxID=2026352 RepID=UPI0035CA6528